MSPLLGIVHAHFWRPTRSSEVSPLILFTLNPTSTLHPNLVYLGEMGDTVDSIEEYERRLAETKLKLAEVQEQLDKLHREQSELTRLAEAWEAVVDGERRQAGITLGSTPTLSSTPVGVDTPQVEVGDPSTMSNNDEEESENKTKFVRDQIKTNAATGVDISQLKKAARVAGIAYPPTWPYGVLSRLKQRGEIFKRKGRFFPKVG